MRVWQLRAPDGSEVELTRGEFRLLRVLALADRAVLARETIAARLGGEYYESFDRSIDMAISRLRRKLAAHGGGEALVRTVRGEGYAFTVPVEPD
ncbi:MAG: winged helix-turn-helix transcriptional regulator [Sphingomonadales bacterium]|nr:winged helix-turn-helix transcriptional regulator [Sphingomonadales bacterium]MBD3774989.1 winged helix-turn-helix transcriptional regulator [Paracoccaceae bacterium]